MGILLVLSVKGCGFDPSYVLKLRIVKHFNIALQDWCRMQDQALKPIELPRYSVARKLALICNLFKFWLNLRKIHSHRNKMKQNNTNRKIVERNKIYTLTHTHARLHFWLGTGTSIKRGGFKLVLWECLDPPLDTMESYISYILLVKDKTNLLKQTDIRKT